MRVFVQVVGEADVGIDPRKCRKDSDLRRQVVERWRDEALSIESSDDLRTFLAQSRVIEPDGSLTVTSWANPPLVGLLEDVGRDEDVELVLVGTQNEDGVPSLHAAETLRILFDRHENLLGPHVCVRVTKADFDPNAIAAAVRSEMWENDPAEAPTVEILWGSGSTEIGLAVIAGVVASGRRWQLRSSRPPFPDVEFLPYLDYPASVAWLLRYGYPERVPAALGPARQTNTQILQAAEAATQTRRRVADGSTAPDDLAGWVRMDARRRNRTSGLAIRAWIVAEFRKRRLAEGMPDIIELIEDQLRGPAGGDVTLGRVIDTLRTNPNKLPPDARELLAAAQGSRPGRWLMSQQVLASAAAESAHEFKALRPNPMERLRIALNGAGEIGPLEGCGPFHLPTGVVGFLWGDGRTEPGRESTLTTVVKAPPPQGLLDYVPPRSEDGHTATLADLLILATAESAPFACEQAREAKSLQTGPYRFPASPEVAVTRYLVRRPGGGSEIAADAQESARTAAEGWLAGRNLDAVVIVPSAPKQQVAGMLNAALAYGHRRAVPVFVLSIAKGVTRFHQFVPYLVTNGPLLELALASLRSLAFDTVTTLVGMCDPPPSEHPRIDLSEIAALSRELTRQFFANSGARARERLELCAKLVNGASMVDQVRLAHVAAEICKKAKTNRRRFGSRLVAVRDALTVNHGEGSLSTALAAAAQGLGMSSLGLGALIKRAAAETGSPTGDPTLIEVYERIDGALRRLLESTRSVDNQPVRPSQ